MFQANKFLSLLTRRLAVDPMPFRRVVDIVSLSTKPHRVVGVFLVWITDFNYMIIDYEPLKHAVDVLICDDRQFGVPACTKLSRIIPTQHWTVRVETILLIVHWVALGEGRYDINGVEQNQNASYEKSEFLFTVKLWIMLI